MRQRLEHIAHIRAMLQRAGYLVSDRVDIRPVSFDLVARRDDDLLILKVLTNIDALGERVASEMKLLARFLGARTVVVGEKSGTGPLEDGVLYYRYGIPILRADTFAETILHEIPPLIYAAPGGYYVRLDGGRLGHVRRQRNISLGELAKIAGVSRRTISMYEEGMSATVDAAARLEEALGEDLVVPLMDGRGVAMPQQTRQGHNPGPEPSDEKPDALETTEGFEREVYTALTELGYEVVPTARSPFNALSSERQTLILTSVTRDDGGTVRKAKLVASLSEVTERPGVFFVRRKTTRTTLEGSAVVAREELARLSDPQDVLQLILERRRAARNEA